MALTEAELDIQARNEAEARLNTARAVLEHHTFKRAWLVAADVSGFVDKDIADAKALVAVREKELADIVARIDPAEGA